MRNFKKDPWLFHFFKMQLRTISSTTPCATTPTTPYATLHLEDGTIIQGVSFGAPVSASGEVVFNTGMVGYPESLTDPSYYGQILVLTYPLIGNYGVPPPLLAEGIAHYFESHKIQVAGLIIADYAYDYHHWNASHSLSVWLKQHNIPALCDVDTRALTKRLREKGTLLGKIVYGDALPESMHFFDPNQITIGDFVSCKEIVVHPPLHSIFTSPLRILLVDTGLKNNIIRCLTKRGCTIIRVPWDYSFMDRREELAFDAVFLTNGPGDPKTFKATIDQIKKALISNESFPIFGICLGNQLLALASGADTYKLKYGHRSHNQPCVLEDPTQPRSDRRCFITSQNHGFAINEKTLTPEWGVWFRNANDHSVEGIYHENGLWSSVQFHPEATGGPTDTEWLFDEFVRRVMAWKDR